MEISAQLKFFIIPQTFCLTTYCFCLLQLRNSTQLLNKSHSMKLSSDDLAFWYILRFFYNNGLSFMKIFGPLQFFNVIQWRITTDAFSSLSAFSQTKCCCLNIFHSTEIIDAPKRSHRCLLWGNVNIISVGLTVFFPTSSECRHVTPRPVFRSSAWFRSSW